MLSYKYGLFPTENPVTRRPKSGYIPISLLLLIRHIPIRYILQRLNPNLKGETPGLRTG